MTPIEVVRKHFLGTTVVSAPGSLNRFVGCRIIYIGLDKWEPMFDFGFLYPDGKVERADILEDWNIEVA
jgi:hypothetical protein